ncbi:hypothetical protein Jiend_03000 [Micromonospora endophytica]|nr:hypothetical protein Jiend_03000 [Micromonospora endophytica]
MLTSAELRANDPRPAARLCHLRLGYILAVACSHQVTTGLDVYRVDALAADLPITASGPLGTAGAP